MKYKQDELRFYFEKNPRQLEAVRHIYNGCTEKEAAEKMNVSEDTVTTHLSLARNVLGVNNSWEAGRHCEIFGLISYNNLPSAQPSDALKNYCENERQKVKNKEWKKEKRKKGWE